MTTSSPAVGLAALLHLAIGVFPIAFSSLLAPAWFTAVAAGVWAVGFVALWRLRANNRRALLVPVVTLALWFAAVTGGDLFLGWTA